MTRLSQLEQAVSVEIVVLAEEGRQRLEGPLGEVVRGGVLRGGRGVMGGLLVGELPLRLRGGQVLRARAGGGGLHLGGGRGRRRGLDAVVVVRALDLICICLSATLSLIRSVLAVILSVASTMITIKHS